MKFNLAFTSPINPPSVSPVLDHAQVWKGLLQKCRKPQDFVQAISDCEILEEDDNGLKRLVTFKPGMGPPESKTTEVLTYHGQTTVNIAIIGFDVCDALNHSQVDFRMIEGGHFITNTISTGTRGPDDLYLTFTFEWNFHDIKEGSKEAEEKDEQLKKLGVVVSHSIDVIRGMVQDGKV